MENVEILLVGNPNAGKSTLFNRLTGGHARVGNWHGVTVTETRGSMKKEPTVSVVDLPGLYDGEGRSLEEKYAADYIRAHRGGVIAFVCEYAGLERLEGLLRAFASEPRRAVLVLTKRRAFERAGGSLNAEALSARLGIPVCDGEGDVRAALSRALSSAPKKLSPVSLEGIFSPPKGELSPADKFFLSPFGFLFFVALMLACFYVTFAKGCAGDLMKEGIAWFFGDFLAGLAEGIPSPVLRSFVAKGILAGLAGVLSFLPQIMLLHLALLLLEESGLMSRLAFLADGALSRIGLSGRAVFSLLMGFGCTSAAILTTRGLDDRAMQKRVILLLPYLSCSAKLPVYLVLAASLFSDPFLGVLIFYALGVALALCFALLWKGEGNPLVFELAPLQIPRPLFVLKSLLFQLKEFIIKVATVILAFFLFSWLTSSFDAGFRLCEVEDSMLASLCGGLKFLFAPVGMGDWRIAYAALSGLIAKENVAGTISMFFGRFPYSGASAFAFGVFILTASPCVSAISAAAKELGKGAALRNACLQTLSALLLCYFSYFCVTGGFVFLALAAAPFAALGILFYEKIHRKKRLHARRIYRRNLSAGVAVSARPSQGAGGARQRKKDGGELPSARGRRGRLLHDRRTGGQKG